jgi:hypothetical protein
MAVGLLKNPTTSNDKSGMRNNAHRFAGEP